MICGTYWESSAFVELIPNIAFIHSVCVWFFPPYNILYGIIILLEKRKNGKLNSRGEDGSHP
jgi:hypothetical protein